MSLVSFRTEFSGCSGSLRCHKNSSLLPELLQKVGLQCCEGQPDSVGLGESRQLDGLESSLGWGPISVEMSARDLLATL